MNPLRYTLPLAGCALLSACAALAQNAPAAAPAGQRPAPAAPSNLQVLPKDISRQDLMSTMRGFTQQLGVECEFCHAANPAPKSDDSNPNKAKARVMITMLNDINTKYLTQLAGNEHPTITCGNCHLGHSEPPAFVPPPRQGGRGPGGPGGPPPAAGAPPRQ